MSEIRAGTTPTTAVVVNTDTTGNLVLTPDSGGATINATGALKLPTGTTAQRPASPVDGMMRMNTTTDRPEWYSATVGAWVNFNALPSVSINYLVIAGGGGASQRHAGGGGAGGFISATSQPFVGGQTYTVTVGAGGSGVAASNLPTVNNTSTAGGNSSITGTAVSVTAIGGARGWQGGGEVGGSGSGAGASGGAANPGGAGTAGQGNAGGAGSPNSTSEPTFTGGGGGGAGGAGANGVSYQGGAGGAGASNSITGSAVTYAGGGGGGAGGFGAAGGAGGSGGGGAGGSGATGAGVSGTANTGGGGGAGGFSSGTNYAGGAGGSGVVIISAPQAATSTTGSPTVTTAGGRTIYTFTGSGSITF